MSDSFADLWNSTAPSKPAEPPRKLGSFSPSPALGTQQRKPHNDVFSMLASAGSNTNSRSTTPSYTGNPQQVQKTPSFGSQAARGGPQPVQKASSQAGDAFGDLLGGTMSSTGTNKANMTIAERAALAEKQKLEKQLNSQQAARSQQQSSVWAGLDSLGSSSLSGGKPPVASSTGTKDDDDWGFVFETSKPMPAPAPAKVSQPVVDDDWGLDDFVSKPAPKVTATTTKSGSSPAPSGSLWDLDEFTSPSAQANSRTSPAPGPPKRSDTPRSFDFGDREDGLLDDRSGDEDDILGALGKPAAKRSPPSQSATPPAPSPQPPVPEQSSRSISPPPHILGQIVEMGFSIQQARVALASTDTGLDVQAALEILLSNGAGARSSPALPEQPRSRQQHQENLSDEEPAPRSRGPPRRNRDREPPPRDNAQPMGGDTQRNLQEQADKILAQASEIGLSMFSRANALWNQGKQKVQQAYEEHAAATTSGKQAVRRDTRPKWMLDEGDAGGADDGWGRSAGGGGFKDSDDEREDPTQPPAPKQPTRPKASQVAPPQAHQDPSSRLRTGDLLGGDSQPVYSSPFRRKATSRSQVGTPPEPARKPTRSPAPPQPVQLVQRNTISAPPSAIASSAKHKAAGTEMFKLGRYAEAETSYSSAIASLPDSHLLLVPLYNNRALARIKTGDHSGAVEDCTTVINLIGASYHPAREAKVTKEDEGSGVDLADALIKALRRRAEAYEGREKWEEARKDWEGIAGRDWAGKSRNEAAQAAGRCRRMLTQNHDAPTPAAAAPTKPKPASKPHVPRVPTPTEALERVREANQAAEAEDQQKFVLKDSVDARLLAWKGGKENNIRALIASLENVLWPELGWQKVGMHELVTPSQVKIRYTKAIAKLHPDKLNVNNTTLEQRMIANGVFGALNDAWNAFKQ